jgi:hypothetical protein
MYHRYNAPKAGITKEIHIMDKTTLIAILMVVRQMQKIYQQEDISQQTDYTMGKQMAADQIVEMLQDTIDSHAR